MPTLLQKLSYFDPDTGGTFIIDGDKFLWKEGKKAPEDSKVTRLVKRYGWVLRSGDDMSLVFKKRGNPGELAVVRGKKFWLYGLRRPGENLRYIAMQGEGLDSLYDALEKDALTGALAKASSAVSTAVNNAGNGHDLVDGDPLPEIHIFGSKLLNKSATPDDNPTCNNCKRPFYDHDDQGRIDEEGKRVCIGFEPESEDEFKKMFDYMNSLDWYGRNPWYPKRYPFYAMRLYSDGWQFSLWDKKTGEGNDLASLQKFLSKFNLKKLRSDYVEPPDEDDNEDAASQGTRRKLYREVAKRVHPDLATDEADRLRRQRFMAEANKAFEKGDEERLKALLKGADKSLKEMGITACLVLSGNAKTASGTQKVALYVSAVEYERGNAFKLASFQYSPDPIDAKVFGRRTAENLVRQIRGLCGAAVKLAKPKDLLTTNNIKTQKQPKKHLLTQHNRKTQKGQTKGFLTGVMHLMPSDLAGYGNVCPCASPECRTMCLNTAGVWANAPAIQNSRRMKTELYFKNRPQFMTDLRRSIQALVRKADRENLTPAVRINGTSDLPQVAMEMAREFPNVAFYDYTKIPQPWKRQLPNYHITFSRSEVNDKDTMDALEHGVNVAVVFQVGKNEQMPKEWRGYPVIDGDKHDLRFLDNLEGKGEGPFIIGLSGKGKARGKDKGSESGFVVDPKKLVQIGPSLTPAPKKEKPEEDKSPVSTTEQRIQERTRPATEETPEEEMVMASAAEERSTPHNEWFIEGCFDGAHLFVND